MSRPIIGYIVDAATRLFTSRRIGGVLFDGTKDIDLPGVNVAGNQNTSGNAATATRLQTNRSFGITGDGTAAAVNFNGTANVSLILQLANITTARTAGGQNKIPIITVDSKGRVTSITEADLPTPPPSVQLRGGTGGTYVSGNITLVAGTGIKIEQSGNNITISLDKEYLPLTGGTVNGTLTVNGEVYGNAFFYND